MNETVNTAICLMKVYVHFSFTENVNIFDWLNAGAGSSVLILDIKWVTKLERSTALLPGRKIETQQL